MELPLVPMNCYKCNHPNLHGSNFCEKCGADLKAPPPPKVTPVRPYAGSPPPVRYTPSSRATPAPKPSPAPRPTPAGSGYSAPPPASPPAPTPAPAPQATPKPSPRPAPPVTSAPRRRDPVISQRQEPTTPSAPRTPRRDPLPFCRLSSEAGPEFLLRYDSNLVGRASPGEGINPQADLTAIDHSGTVSRRHARIGKDDSAAFVEDLGSSNGTRLNGQTLRPGMQSPLAEGDQLIFGDVIFTFHFISSSS